MKCAHVSVAGHFGELLQGRLGVDGPVALVSLPCPELQLKANFTPDNAFNVAVTDPSGAEIPTLKDHLATLLRALDLPVQGQFSFASDMPAGGGAGLSTTLLVAVCRMAGLTDPVEIARRCHAIEGATDPLMFNHAERILWASREVRKLEELPPLPAFQVIGGFGPHRIRTNPNCANFPDISDLLPQWCDAAQAQDLSRLAQLSTCSAQRALTAQGVWANDPIQRLARETGALGVVTAHTGAARGLIFAKGEIPAQTDSALQKAGFSQITCFSGGS